MIKFKELELKNFISVGDNPITLKLDRSPTTLITGNNGVGKCVHPDTVILIDFDESDEFLKKFFDI